LARPSDHTPFPYTTLFRSDRASYLPGTIENNLIVQRTARDEGRLRVQVQAVGKLRLFAEGRLRRRALVEPGADPAFKDVDSMTADRKSTRLNSSHVKISYA